MDEIDINNIIEKYKKQDEIWAKTDSWHLYTHSYIKSFINKNANKHRIPDDIKVINLGSGGNPYCFAEENMLHVDIIDKNIISKPHYLISNVESINVFSNSYDCCLCVGSVINYSDAMRTLKEINRVLKDRGFLFLEFENSRSLEFYLTKTYNKKVAIAETFYQDSKEKLWVYLY